MHHPISGINPLILSVSLASHVSTHLIIMLSFSAPPNSVKRVSATTSPDRTGTKVYYQSGPGLVPVRPNNVGSPSAANFHASH